MIVGVSNRIPYLARNISEVHSDRLELAREEERRIRDELEDLMAHAELIGEACEDTL